MSNTVVAIRAHKLDAQLAAAIEHTRSKSKCRLVIALHDEWSREERHPAIIPFSSRSVEASGISTFGRDDWAWHLGDCAAYAVFDGIEGCDRLLMLEHDVKINADIDALLDDLLGSSHFAAHAAGFKGPTLWSPAAARWFSNACWAFYPVVGMTRHLAELSQRKRREISAAWLGSGADPATIDDHMVHCEAFSASVCADAGLPMSCLSKVAGWDARFFTYRGVFCWEDTRYDQVAAVHPCLLAERMLPYFEATMSSVTLSADEKSRVRAQMDDAIDRGLIRGAKPDRPIA